MLQSVKRRLSTQPAAAQHSPAEGGSVYSPQGGAVARSDLSLPKRERRRSSVLRNQKLQALKDLPHLKDTSMQKREVRDKLCKDGWILS